MLLLECKQAGVEIRLNTSVTQIEQLNGFQLKTSQGDFHCESLVIASGGLSIPTMGASPLGYKVAEQFGINVWPTRAGLVPITLHTADLEKLSVLSGVSVPSLVSSTQQQFRENILFTHRGLSGPAILQISSYWQPGEALIINLLPDINLVDYLQQHKSSTQTLQAIMSTLLPKRVVEQLLNPQLAEKKLPTIAHKDLETVAALFNAWHILPNGTEGYRTAEVTLGGVDCAAISSKTMQANHVAGLYFIGEVLDVTGWLGGYNFQWAWSSGWAAGQVV
jgi:predicted Rossmann fold flavoprotein